VAPFGFGSPEGGSVRFTDRADAGRQLATRLEHLRGPDLVVLGLPRGGVVVAAQVARALDAPLDVLVVRKLGHPGQPELAIGAIGEGGVRVLTPDPSVRKGVDEPALQAVERREAGVLRERVARLRQDHPRVDLRGRVALIVDDGVATGSTIRAACLVARGVGAARVVVGVPVGPADAVRALQEADEVVCLATPARFVAVGVHYGNFAQTTEEEVLALLGRGRTEGEEPPD
jgi:putative phosphoribosyl transferase